MKYIVFNDKKVDTGLFFQLQDLACVLSKMEDMTFQFDFGHTIDLRQRIITASRFWDNLPAERKEAGLKTDILLRTIGVLNYTDPFVLNELLNGLRKTHLQKFGIQLFTLLEDMRIEELCKRERPGASKLFRIRRDEYYKYFSSQLAVNRTRGFELDELFCLIYLTLYSETAEPVFESHPQQASRLEDLKPFLYESYESTSTMDVKRIVEKIVFRLMPMYDRDSVNEYFVSPILANRQDVEGLSIDNLKSDRPLENDDSLQRDMEEDEAEREKLSMWHREQKVDERNQSFLSFELESGTKLSARNGTVREADSGDQAIGAVQGRSMSSSKQDYAQQELDEQSNSTGSGDPSPYGRENKDAEIVFKSVRNPNHTEEMAYREMIREVELHIKRLAKTIEKAIERKLIEPRQDLRFGRLSKKLLPLVFEPNPRVFYKKRDESKEIDAAFTLLVDCSASMDNKMDETKMAIALFHEVLKKLRIPHAIIGFWEDASQTRKGSQPNYFHVVKNFHQSIYSKSGAEIMQLAPQEDNRDGLSIRVVTEELRGRPEKHKFLLVFSDGEPAADGYHENGIVDTREAVMEARKKGIQVIGMFLANGVVFEEDEKTMFNIYDKEHLIIPNMEQLTDQFSSLLKKLLLKSI